MIFNGYTYTCKLKEQYDFCLHNKLFNRPLAGKP